MATHLRWNPDRPAMADAPGGHDEPVHSFGAGRRCGHPGCTTKLSIYNDGALCAAHDLGGRRQRLYVRRAGESTSRRRRGGDPVAVSDQKRRKAS